MIRETYEKLLSKEEIRKNLIELRKQLKEGNNKVAFLYHLAGDYSLFIELLKAEDAKVRKNAALIMGELNVSEFIKPLYEAYQKEATLFIKSDMLSALRHFDYHHLLDELKQRLNFLTNSQFEENSLKHIREEMKILSEMIIGAEKPKSHSFCGYHELSEVILLTNRNHQQVTMDQIHHGTARMFGAGVIVRTDDLNEILTIRTYSDMLFRLKNSTAAEKSPRACAHAVFSSGLLDFLKARHEGNPPYYFRIEMKSSDALDKKSGFTKKMAAELEVLSERQLVNSTSHYEFEIRLIENKEGLINVLLKLYTIKDQRFSYRKNAVAASIAPVNAALIAALAKDYLKEGSQVLDPFCGVGTMLIERNKLVPAKPMYGLDIFGEAIDKAIENAALDDTQIYFINRDFFDFKHNYLFDEIFTNMPARSGRKTEAEIERLYNNFFDKALEVLKDEAIIVMYTRDRNLVRKNLNRVQYALIKEYEISKKEEAYLYILGVKQ